MTGKKLLLILLLVLIALIPIFSDKVYELLSNKTPLPAARQKKSYYNLDGHWDDIPKITTAVNPNIPKKGSRSIKKETKNYY